MPRAPVASIRCIVGLLAACCLGLPVAQGTAQDKAAPDNDVRDYLSANGMLSRGMNELAVAEYRRFLEAHPTHEKAQLARYGLGVALFRMKKFEEAVGELRKLTPDPKFEFGAESLFLAGQADLELKHPAQAAKSFQALLDRFDSHDLADDAAGLLVEAYHGAGQFKPALAACDVLIAKWPASPLRERAEFFAGLSQMALQDWTGAAARFDGWADRFPKAQLGAQAGLLLAQSLGRAGKPAEAIRQYQAVIKTSPDDLAAEAMLGLASVQQQLKKTDDAGGTLEQFIDRFPQHPQRAAAMSQRARLLFDAGQYERATKLFAGAAELDPSHPDEAAYWQAKCDLRQGNFSAAASRLDKAIAAHPESSLIAEMSYDHAVSLLRAGDKAGAGQAFSQFATRYPQHALVPEALYTQIVIAQQSNKPEDCRALAEEFTKRFPSHERAALVSLVSAESDAALGRLPDAAAAYRRFISANPKHPQIDSAKFALAAVLFRDGKLDEAEPLLAELVAGPRTAESFRRGLMMLGDIRFRRSQWSEAAAAFQDYLSFGTDQPAGDEAQLKLGLALSRQGRSDEALAAFASLIAQHPASPHTLQATFESGQIQLDKKQPDAAAKSFAEVIERGKSSQFAPYALFHLGSMASQSGEHDRAASMFAQAAAAASGTDLEPEAMFQQGQSQMAASDYKAAGGVMAELLAKFPTQARAAEARAVQAIALARQGSHAEALATIDAALQPNQPQPEPATIASLLYEKAWCLRELKRDDEAVPAYRAIIADHPREPLAANAMLELADLEAAAGRFKEADELLTRLRAEASNRSLHVSTQVQHDALYRLISAKYQLEQFADVGALADDFLAANPTDPLLGSVRLLAGESLFKLGKHAQAAAHFKSVAQNLPDDAACGPSLLRLGECQAALQQWSDSEASCKTYLERFASSDVWFQAQFGLGWAMENQQRHEDAIAAYKQVIDRHQGSTAARAQFQVGECLFAQHRLEDAVRELLKVDILYNCPEWSAAALYEAGRCLEELGRPEEARQQFSQVQQKHADTRWAALASQRMTALTGRATPGG